MTMCEIYFDLTVKKFCFTFSLTHLDVFCVQNKKTCSGTFLCQMGFQGDMDCSGILV